VSCLLFIVVRLKAVARFDSGRLYQAPAVNAAAQRVSETEGRDGPSL